MKRAVGTELVKVRESYLKMVEEAKRLGVKENDGYYWCNIDIESTINIYQGIDQLNKCTDFLTENTCLGSMPKEISYLYGVSGELNRIWFDARKDRKLRRKTIAKILKVLQSDEAKAVREFLDTVDNIVNKKKEKANDR